MYMHTYVQHTFRKSYSSKFHHKSVPISEAHLFMYKVVMNYSNRTYTTQIEHTLGVKYSNRTVNRTILAEKFQYFCL